LMGCLQARHAHVVSTHSDQALGCQIILTKRRQQRVKKNQIRVAQCAHIIEDKIVKNTPLIVVVHALTWISEVETIKRHTRATCGCMATGKSP